MSSMDSSSSSPLFPARASRPASAVSGVTAPSDAWSVRLGAWVFRQRSWLPVPLAVAVLIGGTSQGPVWPVLVGIGLAAAGESLRLWSVRQIGSISRTRSLARVGPFIRSGPFRIMRNPLYVGNWLLWTGFTVASRAVWMLPVVWAVLAVQDRVIVQWEESRLRECFGERYEQYLREVPRWLPRPWAPRSSEPVSPHPWRTVMVGERGTFGSIALGALLLLLRAALAS
jgi:protein-S-isoprenylcysteine O-methyltransferase Ste14